MPPIGNLKIVNILLTFYRNYWCNSGLPFRCSQDKTPIYCRASKPRKCINNIKKCYRERGPHFTLEGRGTSDPGGIIYSLVLLYTV